MKKTLFFTVVVQIVMAMFLIYGLFATNSIYRIRIISFVIILVAIWFVCYIKCIPYGIEFEKEKKQVKKNVAFITMVFVIALFFSSVIWNKGTLSLAPIARVNLGIQHADALFHSSVAESFQRDLLPKRLVNDELVIYYHTFSHFLMYIISRVTAVPVFIAYNYLYPVVFLPLYSFVQLFAMHTAKECFSGSKELSVIDFSIVTFFNCGILGNSILFKCGIWKDSYILSESYLVGSILIFLFYSILMKAIKEKEKASKVYKRFILLAFIPIGIFLISWSKISLGCLFTLSILYYFFRIHLKQTRYWILNFFYLFVFYICIKLFWSGTGEATTAFGEQFKWLAFGKYCSENEGLLGHYFFLSLMSIIFVCLEIKKNRFTISDFLQGKTLWIEEVILLSIVAFSPSLILDIAGGSAAYFSYFAEIPAMLLLCGMGYTGNSFNERKKQKNDINITQRYKKNYALSVGLFIWCICIGFENSAEILRSEELILADSGSGFYEELMEIRKIVGNFPEKYTIYLEPDAAVTGIATNSLFQIYVYPALTGVGVINASYVQDGLYYDFRDVPVKGYGLTSVQHERLSYDKALKRAKNLGKEKVIHMMKDGYEIDDCR